MPEINKKYNEQEHILLCANGQKEYCEKRRSTEKEEEVGGRLSALFYPWTEVLAGDGRCNSNIIVEGEGVILGYYDYYMDDFGSSIVTLYPDATSTTPITKFPGYPDMVSFMLYDYCDRYNLDIATGTYVSAPTF